MGTKVHRRLLGADRGVPQRRVHGRRAQGECRWAPWARFVLALDVGAGVEASCPARARLALTVLAGLRHGNLEQRGRAVASGGLGVL